MAKSGKGKSAGTADAKSAVKGAAKELSRLEKRLLKARDVETKRKKQASDAGAEVAQLTARIKELKPATGARSMTTPASSRAASPARSRVQAKPAAAKPAAARSAAAKPTVAAASARTKSTNRGSATATTATRTRRKTASSPATRRARTRKTDSADGSGDSTGAS